MNIHPDQIIEIPDICHNKYNFTDGIGMISQELARDVNSKSRKNATAFQFRMGGYKGVVAVDDKLEGKVLMLRPSQKKFKSDHMDFELLGVAEFRHGHLNKQLILLLSNQGIEDRVFMDLLDEAYAQIDNDIKHYFKDFSKSKSRIHSYAVESLSKLMDHPSLNNELIIFEIRKTLKQGVMKKLKDKQRIWVKHSGILMGTVDEKNVLNEDEVFIQIEEDDELKVIQDRYVVIGKNPCLHPGDIRVLWAVNRPELHHMKNTVVFPQKGSRPVPNKCSGSDLDGDLYFVSWDDRLIPQHTEAPMDYDIDLPKVKRRSFNHHTLIKFFIKYAANDNLGRIDNYHLALADQLGALHPKCIKLCELHATAVDFVNNGIKKEIPKELIPNKYPHYMEKDRKRSYRSEKVLGQLYDNITFQNERMPEINLDRIFPGYEDKLDLAREIFDEYKRDIQIMKKRYSIATEIEFLIGQPQKISEFIKQGLGSRELYIQLIKSSNEIVDKFKTRFSQNPSLELAFACYKQDVEEYPAFPWIVAGDYLISIIN